MYYILLEGVNQLKCFIIDILFLYLIGQSSTPMMMLWKELLNILAWMIQLKLGSHLIIVIHSNLNPNQSSFEEQNICLTCWYTTIRLFITRFLTLKKCFLPLNHVLTLEKHSFFLFQTTDVLYYEVLDIPLPELQGLKTLKVAFHHATKDEVSTDKP